MVKLVNLLFISPNNDCGKVRSSDSQFIHILSMLFCIKLSTEIYPNWVVLTRECESVAIRRYGSGSVSTCIWMGLKIGGGGVGDSAHNLF